MNRRVYAEEALDAADSYWEIAEVARASVEYLMRDDVRDVIDAGLADRDYFLQVSAPSTDLETNVHVAMHHYQRAQEYYLRAATEYYVGRPDTRSEGHLATIDRLPSPLRDELGVLQRDYQREVAGRSNPREIGVDELARTAQHVSAVRERIETAIAPTRESDIARRGR